jgi:hypothetical protein
MRLILELLAFRFELELKWYWTRWFFPVRVETVRHLEARYFLLSILWTVNIHLRIPMRLDKAQAARIVSGSRYL